jgi:hypothetical protein
MSAQAHRVLTVLLMLAVTGCVPAQGPAPPEGTPHNHRTEWRAGCSHCWAVAALGVVTRTLAVLLLIILWKG